MSEMPDPLGFERWVINEMAKRMRNIAPKCTIKNETENEMKKLYRTSDAASYLGIEAQTLRLWRHKGKGPKYIRYGHPKKGICVYRPDALDEWLDKHMRDPEAYDDGSEFCRP